jgi:RNA polymerase sigma factor (sigma-70 family)
VDPSNEQIDLTALADGQLVRRVRDVGDTAAYGTLVRRYQGHVYGLAYSLLRDWAEAHDMAQEAFVRAYVNLGTLREPEKFAPWLRRVAFSTCMDWLKRFKPELYRSLGQPTDIDQLDAHVDVKSPSPTDHAERVETAEAVLMAIARLPAKYRIPITMFHLDGLSYQKVAEFLEVPLGTAKSLIHEARKLLKPALAAYAAEVAPVVEDIFREHKLPADFDKTIEPFINAACHGKVDEASELLAKHPDLARADIYTAAVLCDADRVEQFLARDPSLATRKGGVWNWEPILYAASSHFHKTSPQRAAGSRRIVEMLLARGADPNTAMLYEGHYPLPALYWATGSANNPGVAETLLKAGAKTEDGESLFHSAEHLYSECLDLLLRHGAKINWAGEPYGNTALDFNVRWTEGKGVRWLLEHGADPNVRSTAARETALHAATERNRDAEMVALLLDHGADPNATNRFGFTPLAAAVAQKNEPVAKLLIERGAKEDLATLVARGKIDAAKRRVDADRSLLTPERANALLHLAAKYDLADAAAFLLDRGADAANRGECEATPLHWAAMRGNRRIAELLVARGAPLDAKDKEHDATPLGWARWGAEHGPYKSTGDFAGVIDVLTCAGAR